MLQFVSSVIRQKGWSKLRIQKAMHSLKEYVSVEYLGQKQIVPVYQYVCYASSYDMTAIELQEFYKQHSTCEFWDEGDQYKTCFDWRAKKQNPQSETWIGQVNGLTMAGSTLKEDFRADDVLWQFSLLTYNISVMMRKRENKFKQHEHRSFLTGLLQCLPK